MSKLRDSPSCLGRLQPSTAGPASFLRSATEYSRLGCLRSRPLHLSGRCPALSCFLFLPCLGLSASQKADTAATGAPRAFAHQSRSPLHLHCAIVFHAPLCQPCWPGWPSALWLLCAWNYGLLGRGRAITPYLQPSLIQASTPYYSVATTLSSLRTLLFCGYFLQIWCDYGSPLLKRHIYAGGSSSELPV